ncbi:MAG TPA: outer membrane beta-barrel family protein, partial [Chitinophagaceae bacterium]|nr:outer membrane beta-barrel family protein [Chitinophagaceae bacterium]
NRYNLNLNYKYEDTTGRVFNVDAEYGWFGKDNSNLQSNLYRDAQQVKLLQNLYRSHNGIDIRLKAIRVDYAFPLLKGLLETGVRLSSITSANASFFYHVVSTGDSLDNRRSNTFSFKEDIAAAYLSYKKTIRKWTVQTGLRVEQSSSVGTLSFIKNAIDTLQVNTRKQLKPFPSFSISFRPSERHNYSLSYSRRIDRPAYQDLNPFVYLLDELSFWQGNPFLQPQLTHRVSLQYLYRSSTIVGVHFSHTDGYSTRITDTIENSKIVMIPENLGTQQNISLSLTQNLTFKSWWDLSFNATLYRLHNKVAFDTLRKMDLRQAAARFNVQQRFKLPLSIAAEVSAYYNSKRLIGANEIVRANSQVDVAVQKSVWKNKAVLRLAFNDIFKGSRTRSFQAFDGFYLSNYGYYETRQVRLNFTYKFSNKNAKAPRSRSSALENENNRIRN